MGAEIYHFLRQILNEEGLSTAVGDEGGFAPELRDSREAIEFLIEAAHQAGYQPGKDVGDCFRCGGFRNLPGKRTAVLVLWGKAKRAGKRSREHRMR